MLKKLNFIDRSFLISYSIYKYKIINQCMIVSFHLWLLIVMFGELNMFLTKSLHFFYIDLNACFSWPVNINFKKTKKKKKHFYGRTIYKNISKLPYDSRCIFYRLKITWPVKLFSATCFKSWDPNLPPDTHRIYTSNLPKTHCYFL